MAEPITLLILAATAILAVTAVVAIVYWDDIVGWFKDRNSIKEADKANIAFTIRDKINNNEFTLVQGIFNKRTEKVVEGRKMKTKSLDSKMDQVHKDNDLVIYE
jgi:hypothetical protein